MLQNFQLRGLSEHYQPFGSYHLVHGSTVRTVSLQESSGHKQGSIGCKDYAAEVKSQLDITNVYRTVYMTGGQSGRRVYQSLVHA